MRARQGAGAESADLLFFILWFFSVGYATRHPPRGVSARATRRVYRKPPDPCLFPPAGGRHGEASSEEQGVPCSGSRASVLRYAGSTERDPPLSPFSQLIFFSSFVCFVCYRASASYFSRSP